MYDLGLVNSDVIRSARAGDSYARDELAVWVVDELTERFAAQADRYRIDDLIQETALDVFKKLELAPDEPVAFRGFVHSFAGTEVVTATRKRMRERRRVVEPPMPPAESPSAVALVGQQRQLIIEHAQRLQPIFCRALMHVLDGGNYKSLAASEGIPEGTASGRITQAGHLVCRSIEADRRTSVRFRTRPRKK